LKIRRWHTCQVGEVEYGNPKSSMAFFKNLVDGLNHVEYPIKDYRPDYFNRNIVEISFLHNLIFIHKGNNRERANAPDLIQRELDPGHGNHT
jgi:hypothetical protein